MSTSTAALLFEARRALHIGSQGALGELLGSSRRTGQRWETGRSAPSGEQLHELARLVHPKNPALAAELAARGGASLVALGIVPPAPAPAPPAAPAPPPTEDLVDAIVCAAAEVMGVTPADVRPALLAAFARARRIGFDVATVEQALRATLQASRGAAAASERGASGGKAAPTTGSRKRD